MELCVKIHLAGLSIFPFKALYNFIFFHYFSQLYKNVCYAFLQTILLIKKAESFTFLDAGKKKNVYSVLTRL